MGPYHLSSSPHVLFNLFRAQRVLVGRLENLQQSVTRLVTLPDGILPKCFRPNPHRWWP